MSNFDDNFCKNVLKNYELSVLKKYIYVKGIEEWKYIATVHKFYNKLCLTVLSLMYPTIFVLLLFST